MIRQINELLEDPGQFSTFTYPPLQAQICASVAAIAQIRSTVPLYLLARAVSVVASILTIWFVWLIACRWNRTLATVALVLAAFTMEACHQAHWANPESLCTLGIVAATWFSLRGRRASNYIGAGICLGLSICAKYFGVLFLHLPLVIDLSRGMTLRSLLQEWRKYVLFYTAVIGIVALDMGYYLLRHFDRFVDFIQTNSLWAHGRGLFGIHPAPVLPPSYTLSVIPLDVGLGIYLLSVLGLVLILLKHRQYLIFLLIPLPFWLFLEALNYKPARFALHLLPFLVLLAAVPIVLACQKKGRWRWTALAVFAIVAGYSFMYSAAFVQCLDKTRDPRLKMQQWVQHRASEPIALIGFDAKSYRIGLCRYDRSIGFSGEPLGSSDYRYLIVPEILNDVLSQWLSLSKQGYRYTEDDWWPMHPPQPEMMRLTLELQKAKHFRRVVSFDNKPEFYGIPMEYIHLPFSYFWISNLRVDIYEPVQKKLSADKHSLNSRIND